MNLMEVISNAAGSPVSSMAKQFGLGEDQVSSVIQQMIPALTNGVKRNVQQENGLEGLLQALTKGNHERYLENSEDLLNATEDGNGILSHLLGTKDVSRALADRTSQATGVGSDILKKMLPMIAALVMGSLKKQGSDSGLLDQLLGGSTGGGRQTSSSSGGGLMGGLLGGLLGKLFGGGRKSNASPAGFDALSGLLDADGEGSMIDDLLGLAKRFR